MSADSGESGPSGSAFTVGVSVGIGLLLAGAVLILLVLQRYRPEKLKTAKIKLETAKGQMQTVKEQLVQSKQNAMDQFSSKILYPLCQGSISLGMQKQFCYCSGCKTH